MLKNIYIMKIHKCDFEIHLGLRKPDVHWPYKSTWANQYNEVKR